MGCWNKTCALSNLPIFYGERTYVFVLEESSSFERSRAVYPNYLYDPILLPFESTYNDYGAGEDSSGLALPLILDFLKRGLIEKEQGESRYRDVEVKREGFNEEKFFETVHEDRLEIKTYDGPKKVKFVMMRKDVVDQLLEKYVIEEYVRWDDEAKKGVYRKYNFQDILDSIDEFLERCSEVLQSLDEHPFKSLFEFELRHWLGKYEDDNLSSRLLRRLSEGTSKGSSILRADFVLPGLLRAGKFDEAKPLIELALKGVFIYDFMETVRRCWVPPCGEGSQDGDLYPHRLLAQTTIDIADAIDAQFKEEEDDWESEDAVEQSFLGFDFSTNDNLHQNI